MKVQFLWRKKKCFGVSSFTKTITRSALLSPLSTLLVSTHHYVSIHHCITLHHETISVNCVIRSLLETGGTEPYWLAASDCNSLMVWKPLEKGGQGGPQEEGGREGGPGRREGRGPWEEGRKGALGGRREGGSWQV